MLKERLIDMHLRGELLYANIFLLALIVMTAAIYYLQPETGDWRMAFVALGILGFANLITAFGVVVKFLVDSARGAGKPYRQDQI